MTYGSSVARGISHAEIVDEVHFIMLKEQERVEPSAKEGVLRRGRILIADDDASCRELLTLALQAPGIEVVAAADGGELLEFVAERDSFDLIITDVNMPWMEGLQVLASMRESGLATPVLVVTGMTRPDLQPSIERVGRAKLLPKPFTVKQLRTAIAELLNGDDVARC